MQAATKNKWIAIFGAAVRLTASYCAAGPLIQTLLSVLTGSNSVFRFKVSDKAAGVGKSVLGRQRFNTECLGSKIGQTGLQPNIHKVVRVGRIVKLLE